MKSDLNETPTNNDDAAVAAAEDAESLMTANPCDENDDNPSVAAPYSVTSSENSLASMSVSKDEVMRLRQSIRKEEEPSLCVAGVDESADCSLRAMMDEPLSTTPDRPDPIFPAWTYFTEDLLHSNILKGVIAISKHASRNPYTYIGVITFCSFLLAGVGIFTNFTMVFDHEELFTPLNSLPKKHGDWVYSEAGFEDSSDVVMIIHADGDNIAHVDAMRRTFEALDTLRDTPGYDDLCASSKYINLKNKNDCWIWSTTQFWRHDFETFKAETTNDNALIRTISQASFPDGTPVYQEASYGKYNSTPEWYIDEKGQNKTFDLLTYVPNFIINVGLPDTVEGEYFQEVALERLRELKKKWELEDAGTNARGVKLEFFSVYAYLLEYERALMKDMPLVPLTFYIMLLFTCVVFHRLGLGSKKSPDVIEPSRFSLGILSTVTIGMSMTAGYGLMFCFGVPFTNLSQMVPFIILGVGLDDTFIITGAYFRRLAEENRLDSFLVDELEVEKHSDEIITERIGETMEEVGLSIFLTSATTTFAFCLGCMSTIPGIRWVCLYASFTIVFDFFFQITLFVAFLTLDERRMVNARQRTKKHEQYHYIAGIFANFRSAKSGSLDQQRTLQGKDQKRLFTQRVMRSYASFLLRPRVKAVVLVVFSAFFGLCVHRTTLLKQSFNVEDYVPDDSYTKTFFSTLDEYSSIKVPLEIYFRDVNQSDPIVQGEMRNYIQALSDLPQIQQPPDFCWVIDLYNYMTGESHKDMSEEDAKQAATIVAAVQSENRTFTQQLDMILNIPTIRDVYGGDIVRDEDGNILTSRCYLSARHIDLKSIEDQTTLLYNQREIAAMYQPKERTNKNELSFFSFNELFYYWELYTVAVDELVFNTISGVLAVNLIGFILIPHWTAIMFIFPIIVMLYFLLLGTLQFCGVFINAVTYVTIVIAIGLLVDYVMHVLLRYYETTGATREEKVIETLETMGASMLMGGLTTWLGVISLSMSSTKIFNTIFVAFMAMVSWGLLVSLVLMPVVLSICGPVVCTIRERESKAQQKLAKLQKKAAKLTTLPPALQRDVACDVITRIEEEETRQ